jgi:MoaA/NifB/PqqE/SkfB family radical SAM enzyme
MNELELASQSVLKLSKPAVYHKVIKYGMRIVRIEPSYICNMHCLHCCIRELQVPQERRVMTVTDIKNIAEQAHELGFAQFVISGGEPLLFSDFDEIVNAIDPVKFWITTDSNGWFMDEEKSKHLKEIGVDKVQLSIDSLEYGKHDQFRQKAGAFRRAMEAIDHIRSAGLKLLIQTVVDKKRVHHAELIDFLQTFKKMDIPVVLLYAKPVGAWKGHYEVMLDQADIDYIEKLVTEYGAFSHLTPTYDWPGGCIAMKRMINITKYGDVNPCPVMQEFSIGNIFDEPLADIISRGDEHFTGHISTCPMATDKDFINGSWYDLDT